MIQIRQRTGSSVRISFISVHPVSWQDYSLGWQGGIHVPETASTRRRCHDRPRQIRSVRDGAHSNRRLNHVGAA